MNRREFIISSAAAAGVAAASQPFGSAAAEPPRAAARQFYELRLYHLRRGPMQKRFDDFYRDAAIPAMNRAGISPVGVFSVMTGSDSPTMYVLLPHNSAESFATANDRVHSDPEYQKAGAEFANASPADPAYVRVDSSLMVAFDAMQKLETQETLIYESHSKKANKKKIEMFNTAEIALFRRKGLVPVFFGETLVGRRLPNLTYMLVFDSASEREKVWAAFGADPEWKKLSTTPGYTDGEIVSNISNVLLRPAAYSQI